MRPWQVRRWITCALTYKGWRAPMWEPGRWTPLFFWDEAVALAAGHRPCALCRHADFVRFLDAWESAHGDRPRVDPMDRRLHAERVDGSGRGHVGRSACTTWRGPTCRTARSSSRTTTCPASCCPIAWCRGRRRRRLRAGAGPRPRGGRARVLTPPATVAVLAHGYRPVLHPSAT